MRAMCKYIRRIARVSRDEWRRIFRDEGAVLILLLAVLIYSTLYSLGYGGEVLRDIPIVVVDESRTEASRRLIRSIDASPNVNVAFEAVDMVEARSLFYARRAYAVVLIPSDYERALMKSKQATFAAYCDASYLLVYRQSLEAIVAVAQSEGVAVVERRLEATDVVQASAIATPVSLHVHNLYNPWLGYGVFVMPAVLILILQQTALVGIGLVGGTRNMHGKRRLRQPLATLIGRTVAYTVMYGVLATYIFVLHYRMFGYPMNGSVGACVVLIALDIVAIVLLGLALCGLYRSREDSLVLLLWSSIPALLVSGVSLPAEAFPKWLYMVGKLLPSSSAVEGYVRIQTMGASLTEVAPQMLVLGVLVVVYGAVAYMVLRSKRN